MDIAESLELAGKYYFGDGVEQSYKKAINYYQNASRQNDGTGLYMLGVMAQEGLGQEKDMDLAARFYKKGADVNNARAALNYGACLELGEGVAQNINSAKKYYQIAADSGITRGMYNLAALLYSTAQNYEGHSQALYWYCRAFETGTEKAKEGIINCLEALKIKTVIQSVLK